MLLLVIVLAVLFLFCHSVEVGLSVDGDIGENINTTVSFLRRHGSLQGLVDIMNSNTGLFQKWSLPYGSAADYESLINAMIPWTIGDLATPLRVTSPLIPLVKHIVDCADPAFSAAFTGKKHKKARLIIDFIPFGYDVEKLEIRFLETYDVVDVFVLYEAPVTQSGMKKPMLYSTLLTTPRFSRWSKKVIYVSSTVQDLQPFLNATNSGEDYFAMEKSMRTEMIRLFKATNNDNPLKKRVMKRLSRVLALQNDADEISNGRVLLHIKHCKLRHPDRRLYLPCISFKKNFLWLQQTHDMGCLRGGNANSGNEELKNYLWRPGPFVWPLSSMLSLGSTGRLHVGSELEGFCEYHTGLGSAVHMSSVAEPGEYLLKRCGVIEQDYHGALSGGFVHAASRGRTTAALLVSSTLFPWCLASNPAVHASNLKNSQGRDEWLQSLPWSVRLNPCSYPFLVPSLPIDEVLRDLQNTALQISDMKLSVKSKKLLLKLNHSEQLVSDLIEDYLWMSSSGLSVVECAQTGFAGDLGKAAWADNCSKQIDMNF